MRFGLRAKSVEDVNKVKTGLIKTRRIIFTPSQDLKDELADTAIQITCYDRNDNIVKRVTSADAGEDEDTENEENGTGSENEQGTGSEQGSGSCNEQGSGSETGDNNGSNVGSGGFETGN